MHRSSVESGVASSGSCIFQFGTINLCATILVIAAALVGAGNASGRALATAPHAAVQRTPQAAFSARKVRYLPALEEQVLTAINDLRQEYGLVALRLNAQLAATARQHSLSMAEHGYFEHTSLDGSSFWKRDRKYAGNSRPWALGENLAWASPGLSARQTLALWLASPTHRENLLLSAWREIGLGAVHALSAPGIYEGLDATILTADFGVRRR
jgi:uncharacterized protein YkwD